VKQSLSRLDTSDARFSPSQNAGLSLVTFSMSGRNKFSFHTSFRLERNFNMTVRESFFSTAVHVMIQISFVIHVWKLGSYPSSCPLVAPFGMNMTTRPRSAALALASKLAGV
jgi:hypothetical protein